MNLAITEKLQVRGVSDDVRDMIDRLYAELVAKRPRNVLRDAYYDGKRAIRKVSSVVPPQYYKLALTLGWTANPVLNLDMLWQGWNVGLQAGPMWATRRYHAYFYDVAPAYATATRAAYNAPSGNAGWRWTAGASRRYGKLWVGGFVRGDSVSGAAFEASPLVKQRHAFSVGLAMSWVFAVSDERVAIDD